MRYLFFILFFSFLSFGQKKINHFSFNDIYDFNVNTVYDINERSDHTMWFGTSEGLISFDGVSFKKYTHNQYSISYTNIKFDKEGRVWCSNFGGQLFYLENDSLKLAVNWSSNSNFIDDYFIHDLPNIIVVSSALTTINKYSLHDKSKQEIIYSDDNSIIFSLFSSERMQLAIHTKDATDSSGTIKLLAPGSFPDEENVIQQYEISIMPGKNLFIGDSSSLFMSLFSYDSYGRVIQFSNDTIEEILPNVNLTTYSFNSIGYLKDQIWILSKEGVSIYNKDGTPFLQNAIKEFSASCIYEDFEGNVWIGSLNKGIYFIPATSFHSLQTSSSTIHTSTFSQDGTIYMLDDQGLLIASSPPYSSYKVLVREGLEPTPLFFDENKQRLYLGSFVKYYSIPEKKIVSIKHKTNIGALLFKAAADIGSGYYVTTNYSKSYLITNYAESENIPLNLNANNNSTIREYRGKHICTTLDKTGLYIDYIDGLFYYDKTKPPTQIFKNNQPILASIIAPDATDNKTVWVGTKSQEIIGLSEGKVIFEMNLPINPSKIVTSKEYVFIGSQNGIYRYHKKTKALDLISETHGWKRGAITSLSIWEDQCVVVGNKYIQQFPIDLETKNNIRPSVYFNGLTVGDSSFALPLSPKLSLPTGSNYISIFFRSLSLRSQKLLTYQYRLKGTSDWITSPYENPEARFLNLEAGNYTFEVRACNESNVCSEAKTIFFTIEKPYYKKWWFIAVVFILIAIVIFIVLRERFKIKERQEKLKSEQQRLRKEAYKSKIAAIRSQMNPHFMFNALNTIQEFILSNQQEIASEYLADFADLMRIYLDQSREDNVSIRMEVETLELYLRLENLRFNGELHYEVKVEPLINKDGTFIPVMLLQPYVENSIKHGLLHKKGDKKLIISFSKLKDGGIKCTIEDNGIGRSASSNINKSKSIGHKSFATGANKHRIDLINQNRDKKIKVDIIDLYSDKIPTGTRVEIYIN